PQPDQWEYDRQQLFFKGHLGEGQFGTVSRARALDIRDQVGEVDVAVKQCGSRKSGTTDSISVENMYRFVKEANVMKRFDHRNVLRLLGVCLQEEPLYVITELMEKGDLLSYLRTAAKSLTTRQLTAMSSDVAEGMSYLHSLQFVHGDLACRNCLVNANGVVKIADFGLSKDASYKGYYARNANDTTPVPIRWMSPETLIYGRFTLAGDVWAMGIVLFEIFSHGQLPYAGIGNQQILHQVEKGYRLTAPKSMSEGVAQLMNECWLAEAEMRPSMRDVSQ
ncbi:uncharacterized protein MONBRDRAFT_2178, partial [Monosiga brevicollis MX1]